MKKIVKLAFPALFALICSCSSSHTLSEDQIKGIDTINPIDPPVEEVTERTFKIASATELSQLTLAPGDVVIFNSGTYADQNLIFTAKGTAANPITLRGERAGEVIFTGASSLQIAGEFLNIENFYFKEIPPIKGSTVIDFRYRSTGAVAYDCKLSNCAISANTQDFSTIENVWVQLRGQRNTVENCSFDNKKNMGQILTVLFDYSEKANPDPYGAAAETAPSHKILNNYFRRENTVSGNGQETIRIGTGEYSDQDGNCTVENNMFYRCDPEAEAVSNKTWRNKYRNNLFVECQGALTIRQGDNCLVESNYFIGNGIIPNGGIRLTGNNQIVRNNYFENGRGTKNFAAICMIQGEINPIEKRPPLYAYAPIVDGVIEDNIIVNCLQGISVSYGTSTQNIGVQATVRNNIICNDNSTNETLLYWANIAGQTPSNITWEGNTFFGGKYTNKAGVALPALSTTRPTLPNVTAKLSSIKANAGSSFLVVAGK